MKYFCNPLKMEYRFQFVTQGPKTNIYREAADPSLILFKDLYYLFPSMTAGFLTSTDLVEWDFHPFINDMPVCDYAPDVRVIGDYVYFSASKHHAPCHYFRTKDPLTEPFETIEGTFPFWDPNLFQDDDGRVYFYWGCSNITPIYGVELDPETMKPKTEPLVMFDSNKESIGYERFGVDHSYVLTPEEREAKIEAMVGMMMAAAGDDLAKLGVDASSEEALRERASAYVSDRPYIEGAWLNKYKGKYYLQYAVPGTQFDVYGDGVYIADKPLGPYKLAKNNPFSYKPGGFINGAGHGSTLEDRDGKYWHTSTMSISVNADFERRLGLWKAGFDADGELYCDQRYGDWPTNIESPAFTNPDWMLLSYGKPVKASSGTGTEKVTDEDVHTWWKAATNRPGEWIELDLGSTNDVRAIQVNFAEDNIDAEIPTDAYTDDSGYQSRVIDKTAHRTRWTLEGSIDGSEYFVIEDKSAINTDFSHDFILKVDGIDVRYLKLTVHEVPFEQPACISGLRVFGVGKGNLPQKTSDVAVLVAENGLDMDVSWDGKDATGYNILWGFAPDKLYHSFMVFGKQSRKVGALIKGEPLYVRVDAFNEAGITEGDILAVIE